MEIVNAFFIFASMPKGRDKYLIETRDRKMFERFYFWSEVQRLRFDDTIAKLAHEEFFLSELTVLRIIKRLLMSGEKVDGKTIQKSRYLGFRYEPKRSSKRVSYECSLFPE